MCIVVLLVGFCVFFLGLLLVVVFGVFCFYVLLLSVLPAFLFVVVPSDDLNRFDLIFQSVTFLALSLLLCLICSCIARRPKQYY